ncbi:hypothetical protein VKT23_016944 [Stygiomarasmius scandens]|uniref:Uncharacterized protein n=1 Tax=Marasmiellus scandens TaxID=2682957 RepID=A0ABR1IUY3_9AGAR
MVEKRTEEETNALCLNALLSRGGEISRNTCRQGGVMQQPYGDADGVREADWVQKMGRWSTESFNAYVAAMDLDSGRNKSMLKDWQY